LRTIFSKGWFEVIVGKSMSQDGESSKCFGFVNRYDTKPKRRLFEMLAIVTGTERPSQ
jgi:hypothetical protein